eukprot:TRINITY_DN712_c0_g6_i1.p1 TRINITY_DN712_c0_g6~~TRINITY_DN712_c0_g6_i1.p1  ORF type:complete len:389 (+),score=69.53 TRINITY_DN712_c0_g6_i1:370-1536(+)
MHINRLLVSGVRKGLFCSSVLFRGKQQRSFSTQPNVKVAEITYNRGSLSSLLLPLPVDNKKCSFPLYLKETVENLVDHIRNEDRPYSNIFISHEDGSRVPHSTPIHQLIKSPFVVNIDGEQFSVPKTQGDLIATQPLGVPEINDLTLRVYYEKIRERLKAETRYLLPTQEYLGWCQSFGISENRANVLLNALHHSGIVYHFSKDVELSKVVFLKPSVITQTLEKNLGIRYSTKGVPIFLKEIEESILPHYIPLNNKKIELDMMARRSAKRSMIAGFAYLLVQFGILARMVWIDFNWDIMEPVTYFVGLTTLMMGYVFFVLYNEEYSYNALENHQRKKALRKLYIKEEFNWKLWNSLDQQLNDLVQLIGWENLPKATQLVLKEKGGSSS